MTTTCRECAGVGEVYEVDRRLRSWECDGLVNVTCPECRGECVVETNEEDDHGAE